MILQFLDILKLETGLITTIMDVFLRLSWSHLPWIRDKDRLWLTEPEIHFDGQSLLVPRVVPDFEMNSRHNPTHLQSLQEFHIDQHFVEIKESSQGVAYIEKVSQNIRRGVDLLPFRTRFSVPLSPSVSNRLFLWLGTTRDGTCTALGLTERNTSNVLARIKDVYILDEEKATVELFRLAASFIFARHLALSTPSHGSILIYSPANSMTAAVQQSHRLSGRDIHFVSSKSTSIGKGCSVHCRRMWLASLTYPLLQMTISDTPFAVCIEMFGKNSLSRTSLPSAISRLFRSPAPKL
jgi:aspyridone synthetase (hybrid polyketide synthase/nonribosomal peptide synthetase)